MNKFKELENFITIRLLITSFITAIFAFISSDVSFILGVATETLWLYLTIIFIRELPSNKWIWLPTGIVHTLTVVVLCYLGYGTLQLVDSFYFLLGVSVAALEAWGLLYYKQNQL